MLQILFCALALPPNLWLEVELTATRKSSVISNPRQRREHGPKTGRRVMLEGYWLSGRGVARGGPSGSAAPGGRVQGAEKLIL